MYQGDCGEELALEERPVAAGAFGGADGEAGRRWITPREAARRAEVTTMTVYRWVAQYGIGWRAGGRFRIDPDLLDKVLNGQLGAPRTAASRNA
jgi:excisionase family DNA binding protein